MSTPKPFEIPGVLGLFFWVLYNEKKPRRQVQHVKILLLGARPVLSLLEGTECQNEMQATGLPPMIGPRK